MQNGYPQFRLADYSFIPWPLIIGTESADEAGAEQVSGGVTAGQVVAGVAIAAGAIGAAVFTPEYERPAGRSSFQI